MENENSTSGESSSQSNDQLAQPLERKSTRGIRLRGQVNDKFLHNFDPEHSEREKRKLHRRLYQGHRRLALYNEKGVYMKTGDDLCDCLNLKCPGCHFPCPTCSSAKCGPVCRNYRKWMYESIDIEGTGVVIKNPLNKPSTS